MNALFIIPLHLPQKWTKWLFKQIWLQSIWTDRRKKTKYI